MLFADSFRSGDIIFRQENTFLSKMFASFEQADYAHVGIIWQKADNTFVVHSEIADGEDGLRVQTLNDFVKNSQRYMVLRNMQQYNLEKINFSIEKYIKLKPKFSLDPKTSDSSHMYCTELVCAIYKTAYGIWLASGTTKNARFEFISTKDIYNNPNLTLIKKVGR